MKYYTDIRDFDIELLQPINWFDSFIKEAYFSTMHHFHEMTDTQGNLLIGDVESPLSARIIVATPGLANASGMELVFCDLLHFNMNVLSELSFSIQKEADGSVTVDFRSLDKEAYEQRCYFHSKMVYTRLLEKECFSPLNCIGFDIPTEPVVDVFDLEGLWRQCPICYEA